MSRLRLLLPVLLCACFAKSLAAETYRIAGVTYSIRGATQQYPLTRSLDVDEKTIFQDRSTFEAYVDGLRQALTNNRIFDFSDIAVSYESADENGLILTTLTVTTVDTWNIIVIPYPRYDSNTGFKIKLKCVDYNFLGTMQEMSSDILFGIDQTGQGAVGADFAFSAPFSVWGQDLTYKLDTMFSLPFGEVPEARVLFSVDWLIPTPLVDLHAIAEQELHLNDRNDYGNLYVGDELYLREKITLNAPFKVAHLDWWGDLTVTPELSFTANLDSSGIDNEDLAGPDASASCSMALSRIDWIENYRQGASGSVSLSVSPDLRTPWTPTVLAYSELQGHIAFGNRAGLNTRLYLFDYFGTANCSTSGNRMRGVLDGRIISGLGGVLNVAFPFTALKIDLSTATGPRWLPYLGFEMQLSPFCDLGWFPDNERALWASSGLEMIVYPLKMRSIYGRASLGLDLVGLSHNGWNIGAVDPLDGSDANELFLGIGLSY